MLKAEFKSKDFIGSNPDYKSSETVMVGLPFESTTTNRAGTKFAYSAIVPASREIEENSRLFGKTMEEGINFFDAGELDLPKDTDGMISMIHDTVLQIYQDKKRYFGIGGEHLVTLPAIMAISNIIDPKKLAVVHFDAHGDMAKDVYGNPRSHGTVINCISEIIPVKNIKQIGIRSAAAEEWKFMQDNNTLVHDFSGLSSIADKNIFLTFDVDCFCPSLMPGTGTPVPGGMSYSEVARWILELGSGRYKIIGADMVELAPQLDASGMSTNVATYLAMEMLFMMGKRK